MEPVFFVIDDVASYAVLGHSSACFYMKLFELRICQKL